MEPIPSQAGAPRRRSLVALALCAAAYLYVFPYYPGINNPNENVRLYMTAAIVEHGTYRIDAMRERWGWTNDAAVYEDHYYSVKAPGTSLLGIPGYAAYHWIAGDDFDRTTALWLLRVTATVLPMLVFLWFFHRWLGRRARSPVVRDAVFVSVALGTLLFGYGVLFVSHALSAATAFGAFMLLDDARRRGNAGFGAALAAGLLAAGATLLEYPGLLASVALSVYALFVLRPRRRLLPFALGGVVPALLMMHFQWRAFGSPFSPGHLYVETKAFRAAHESGLYGADSFHWDAAAKLLVDWRWGLFVLTPILLFALWGFVRLVRERSERAGAIAALGVTLPTYLVICLMNNWTGGWSIGPRYLALVVPFVAWGAVAGLDPLAARWPRATAVVALGATAAGLVASGIPSMYYPHLPPELTQPLPQLFGVLIAHDYAPHNAGNLVGWYGTASMVPVLLLLAATLGWAAAARWRGRQLAVVLAGAVALGAVALVPHGAGADTGPKAMDAVAFVTRKWAPGGHDRATRLAEWVRSSKAATPDDWRRLADLYFAEGRDREARKTIRALRRRSASRARDAAGPMRARSP